MRGEGATSRLPSRLPLPHLERAGHRQQHVAAGRRAGQGDLGEHVVEVLEILAQPTPAGQSRGTGGEEARSPPGHSVAARWATSNSVIVGSASTSRKILTAADVPTLRRYSSICSRP